MKIAGLPDLHANGCDMFLLREAKKYIDWFKPDVIIQLGDIIDAKFWSRFAKDIDDDSPTLEWEKTEEQMRQIHAMFPNMLILKGNHCSRIMNKSREAGIPRKLIRDLEDVFDYKGWHWYTDNKPLKVDGITFIHGDEISAPLSLLAQRVGGSVCRGHTHQAGIIYSRVFDRTVFACEAGCIIDENHPGMRYAAKNPKRCMMSFVTIDSGVPSIIPLS